MNKIDKLTKQQESKLASYKERWLKIGLSCEKVDHKLAESLVDEVYVVAGLKPTLIKIWLQSPLQGVIGATYLKEIFKHMDQVLDQVRDQVWAQVGVQVGAQVRDQVGAQVWAQVGVQVGAQVGDQVRDQVLDQVLDQVGAQINKCGYGLHDASWLGFYDFFKQELALDCVQKLVPLINFSEHCGWWWPFEGAVILTEKPTEIYRDSQNRLHNTEKAALLYPDGWGVWAIHGVRVPEKYILTHADKIDPKEVLKESNAEIRMAIIRKVGFERFLDHLPHKVISECKSTRHPSANNKLLEIEIEDEKVRYLQLFWKDKFSEKTTFIGVYKTLEEFKENTDPVFSFSIPRDPNDCEQIRLWTLKSPQFTSMGIET